MMTNYDADAAERDALLADATPEDLFMDAIARCHAHVAYDDLGAPALDPFCCDACRRAMEVIAAAERKP